MIGKWETCWLRLSRVDLINDKMEELMHCAKCTMYRGYLSPHRQTHLLSQYFFPYITPTDYLLTRRATCIHSKVVYACRHDTYDVGTSLDPNGQVYSIGQWLVRFSEWWLFELLMPLGSISNYPKNYRSVWFGSKRNEETKPATLQRTPSQAIFNALEKVEFNKTNGRNMDLWTSLIRSITLLCKQPVYFGFLPWLFSSNSIRRQITFAIQYHRLI